MTAKPATPKEASKELAVTKPDLVALEDKIAKLDEVAARYSGALVSGKGPFASTMILAQAMGELRELMTPEVMAPIMALMNSPLGFLTDRDPKKVNKKTNQHNQAYPMEVVRDCAIEASLRGFAICGNEFNIIAERFYGAKAGFERLVRSYPGISNYKDGFAVPRNAKDSAGAVVTCWAEWQLQGMPSRIEREFAIKGDGYATADSYIGKASRKLAAAVYAKLTGNIVPEGEVGEEPSPKPQSSLPVMEEDKPKAEAPATAQQEERDALVEVLRFNLKAIDMNEDRFIAGLVGLGVIPEAPFGIVDLPIEILRSCAADFGGGFEAIANGIKAAEDTAARGEGK